MRSTPKKRIPWDERELKILRNTYRKYGPVKCRELLPNRSEISIRSKANLLRLTAKGGRTLWGPMKNSWTEAELLILRNNYLPFGPKKCFQLLYHRSKHAIFSRARDLGLTGKKRWPPSIKAPEIDPKESERYKRKVYKVYLVGNKRFALVEKRDLQKILKYRWYLIKNRHTDYAYTKIGIKTIYMHRIVNGTGEQTDHKNRNGLDNVRKNLRPCTRSQNGWNRPGEKGNKFKGVYLAQDGSITKPWFATIMVNGKQIYLGHHCSQVAAAQAVNEAIQKYHGKFGVLNKV